MTDVDQVARAAPAVPAETNRERVSRRQVDKFAERRAQLADAALQTLAELGYARTSLREIAQNSQFSHGVLHYYFSDKEDLITHCVRQYEAACVTRYDEIVATAASAGELKREFSAAMAQTLRTDAPMHRLWYDLRNQSLFEESFRADVLEIDQRREEMIWRVISRYASFAGVTVSWSPSGGVRASWTDCSSRRCCITWPVRWTRPATWRRTWCGCSIPSSDAIRRRPGRRAWPGPACAWVIQVVEDEMGLLPGSTGILQQAGGAQGVAQVGQGHGCRHRDGEPGPEQHLRGGRTDPRRRCTRLARRVHR